MRLNERNTKIENTKNDHYIKPLTKLQPIIRVLRNESCIAVKSMLPPLLAREFYSLQAGK
jgi:hypothetical protein